MTRPVSPANYSGTCELVMTSGCENSLLEPRLLVKRADPRVKIVGNLIREAKTTRPGLDDRPLAQVDGDLFRINAHNRTVVYRLVEYLEGEDVYLAEWPD